VKCITATDCVAVGGQARYNEVFGRRLVEHWNGIAWSIVASPGPAPASNSYLGGLSCATRTNCMAVGHFTNPSQVEKTLVVRYSE
jgi:hypothetical protein